MTLPELLEKNPYYNFDALRAEVSHLNRTLRIALEKVNGEEWEKDSDRYEKLDELTGLLTWLRMELDK